MTEKNLGLNVLTSGNRMYHSPQLYCLLLVLLFLLSFYIRVFRYEDAIDTHGIRFNQVDGYYHMRRVHASVPTWPWLLQFDSYLDFPHGAGVVLAPGFSFMLSTAGLIAGGGRYCPESVDLAAALLPPFLGALVVFSLALVARQLFGKEAAIWAGMLFAVMNGGIWPSIFGSADHHVAEYLFTPLLFSAFLVTLRVKPDPGFRARIPRIVFLALTMTVSQLIWRGAIAFISVFIVATLFLLIWRRIQSRHHYPDIQALTLPFLEISIGLLATVSLLFPWCVSSWFGRQGMIVYYALSWFHPLYYLAWAIVSFLIFYLFGGFNYHVRRFHVFLITSFALVTVVLLIVSPVRPDAILDVLIDGVAYLNKSDVWMQTISETQPLFQKGLTQALSTLSRYCGFWCFLIPFLIPFLIRGRKMRLQRIFLIIWLLFTYVLTFTQLRYNHQLSVVLCLIGGWSLVHCRLWLIKLNAHSIRTRFKPYLFPFLVTALIAMLVSLPSSWNLTASMDMRGGRMNCLSPSLAALFRWFDTETPPTQCYENPVCAPEYGIMSIWDFGNWLLFYGKRPVIASNFGFLHKGLATACEFFSTPFWPRVEEIIRQNKIRYILLGDFSDRTDEYARIYINLTGNTSPLAHGGGPISDMIYRSDALADSIVDGDQGIREHLRLRYESPPMLSHLDLKHPMIFKIFEYVPGCLISISANAQQKVSLSILLITNQHRRFLYRRDALTDDQGRLQLRIPYSTDSTARISSKHVVHALSNCRLAIGDKSIDLVIPEQHVLSGDHIVFHSDLSSTQSAVDALEK